MNRQLVVDNVRKFTLVRPSYPNRQILQVFGYYSEHHWESLGSRHLIKRYLLVSTNINLLLRRQFIERGLRYDE